MSRRKSDSGFIALAWILNLAGLGGIALVFGIYFATRSVQAAPVQQSNITDASSFSTLTPFPSIYYLPTVTRNPRSTQIVVETPTPFVLPNGFHAPAIGYSVSGRPIELYTFGNGKKQHAIVAGIHGGYEWNTIALADQLILYLNDHPEVIPKDITLYIIRNMNPDGDARDHGVDGRVNNHGVDLNRNFPVNWVKEWNHDNCWNLAPTTGGTGPGSEPETRAVMSFLQSHKIEALISYHSAALGIFPGGTPWDKNSISFAKAIRNVSTYPFPPLDIGCTYTGTLADYAVSLGAAAVDMELTDHKNTDYDMNLKVLTVLLNWKP
jgi:Zinc carboxypeptidase